MSTVLEKGKSHSWIRKVRHKGGEGWLETWTVTEFLRLEGISEDLVQSPAQSRSNQRRLLMTMSSWVLNISKTEMFKCSLTWSLPTKDKPSLLQTFLLVSGPAVPKGWACQWRLRQRRHWVPWHLLCHLSLGPLLHSAVGPFFPSLRLLPMYLSCCLLIPHQIQIQAGFGFPNPFTAHWGCLSAPPELPSPAFTSCRLTFSFELCQELLICPYRPPISLCLTSCTCAWTNLELAGDDAWKSTSSPEPLYSPGYPGDSS